MNIPLTKTLEVETIGQNEDGAVGILEYLAPYLSVLWKDWPAPMTTTGLGNNMFSLNGECPHCRRQCSFIPATSVKQEVVMKPSDGKPTARACAVMQCQGCGKYILGFITWKGNPGQIPSIDLTYEDHYPMGVPDDTVSEDVPEGVASGFSEAIRCRSVSAFSATVLMCRRCLQVSCDMEKATGKDLFKQVDDLASKQRITDTLRQMAHRIRLLGKQGAHGDYSDIDDTVTAQDADDAITFMRHYLDHVYVLPARLAAPVKAATP